MKQRICKVWASSVKKDGEETEYQLSANPFFHESFMEAEWQRPHITWKLTWKVFDNWQKDVGWKSRDIKDEYFETNEGMILRLEELATGKNLTVICDDGYHDVCYSGGSPHVKHLKTWSNFD